MKKTYDSEQAKQLIPLLEVIGREITERTTAIARLIKAKSSASTSGIDSGLGPGWGTVGLSRVFGKAAAPFTDSAPENEGASTTAETPPPSGSVRLDRLGGGGWLRSFSTVSGSTERSVAAFASAEPGVICMEPRNGVWSF